MTDFDFKTFPLLRRRLTTFAAHRIAGSTEHLESEIKGEILFLGKQESNLAFKLPLMKRRSEFTHNVIPMKVLGEAAGNDAAIRDIQLQIRQQQEKLANVKRTLITPTQFQFHQAEKEVAEYLKAIAVADAEALESFKISNREKFHLSKVPNLFTTQQKLEAIASWSYGDEGYSPTVEPLLQSFALENGKEVGFITRNRYGCRILNALHTMFVDIDMECDENLPEVAPWQNTAIKEGEILEEIASVCQDWELSFEIYRTRNGFRLIELSRLWDTESVSTSSVLEALGCDRLFTQLCKDQGTFRARLQKKPWRDGNGVCAKVITITDGSPINPEAGMIRDIHDSWCLKGEVLA